MNKFNLHRKLMMIEKEQQLALIKHSIKLVQNYPKRGILFRDITSLLENPRAYAASIALLVNHFRGTRFTKIVSTEARGFLFGAPMALTLGLGFIPVRKSGKLPRETMKESYVMEYGVASLEIHKDAITTGDKLLVVDDLLATGGTTGATVKLIRQLGGEVTDAAFVINLVNLGGNMFLDSIGINSYSLIHCSSY